MWDFDIPDWDLPTDDAGWAALFGGGGNNVPDWDAPRGDDWSAVSDWGEIPDWDAPRGDGLTGVSDWTMPGGGGGDWSSILGSLGKLFGGSGGGGGGAGGLGGLLTGLLGLGGTVYGGINNKNATEEAQARMEKAVAEANESTRSILGGAGDAYKPYSEAGASALSRLSGMAPSNLAAGFGPVGQASNLAAGIRPGQQSNLASRFRPLGSGRGVR